ncbi:hypothetical protein L249_3067 [Ophiocordyceps polyrhachis-furcata BCC 54312]|uniref:Uncharacterized protein n=1 Tax=Ophiocordyceps polyrhachis-furcata BCC 54312 TaxID=1330021 RepID=A0A367LNQ6_9HYPO|nr:hypothetical protein L249_3067 [Ophiocordyceps polyrhachis-furcata BCC 54312]
MVLTGGIGGPGSAASSVAESIVKPVKDKTPCIDCGDFECCCIPIPCVVIESYI